MRWLRYARAGGCSGCAGCIRCSAVVPSSAATGCKAVASIARAVARHATPGSAATGTGRRATGLQPLAKPLRSEQPGSDLLLSARTTGATAATACPRIPTADESGAITAALDRFEHQVAVRLDRAREDLDRLLPVCRDVTAEVAR